MKFINTFFSPYTWRLALRDARPQWKSLLLYTSAVIAGVAALVAILSFRNDVLLTVDDQAKELLGADLEFRSSSEFPEPVNAFIDSIGGSDASLVEFNSMVQFLSSGDTRLSQIRALEGPFPFYGTIETVPAEAAAQYQQDNSALVEQSTMKQFGISVGDSIQVGQVKLPISGELRNVPGESAAFSLVGPRVYVPKQILEDSGLLQRGSRVTYKEYVMLDDPNSALSVEEEFRSIGREHNVRTETVEEEKEEFGEIVDNLSKFLGLIAFIALLLGGLGVASAVYVYIRRKTDAVATLRCLGMSSEQIISAFTLQIGLMGLTGAAIGTVIGLVLQSYLPLLFTDFLPFDIIQTISVPAVLLGLFLGVAISVGFSILPLIGISSISPMLTLKSVEFSPLKNLSPVAKWSTLVLSFLVILGLISYTTESIYAALGFSGGLIVSVALLWGIAHLLMSTVKGLRLKSFSYVWRQGTANLFRPNNQTPMLLTTLGMGMLLIGTLYLSQEMLLERINLQSNEDLPNIVLYDIQSDQNSGVNDIVESEGGQIMQNVPIVSMRLSDLQGRTVDEIRADTTSDLRGWALRREYRVTYREELTESETLTDGEWISRGEGFNSVVPISVAEQIREDLRLEIGDSLSFNVQGVEINTVVASFREVDFQNPEPNFFILFPTNVLEDAPQFFATIVKTESDESAYAIQQEIVREYPNISAIDLSIALQSIQEFLDKISMAIQFMALFSILTGLIVLASSISISRKQRTRESVLLRTLGAVKSQISRIQTIEYVLLGLLATLTGLVLAFAASWSLAYFYFDLTFVPDLTAMLVLSLIIILAATLIGWTGSRHIFKSSPIDVLRSETG
ncbi:MAG: FtsX-like permease family protein [Balneolaceae bacterium]